MVAAIVGVAGAAASAYGANQQGKASKKAGANAAALQQQQLDLTKQQMGFNQGVYNNWQQSYAPVLASLKDQALAAANPNYQAIDGDVAHSFDASQGINQRNMQRYGINPTDGAAQDAGTAYGIGRATAMVGAHQQARTQAQQTRFSNLASLYGLGNSQMQASLGGYNDAAKNGSQALGGAANQQYGMAAASGQAAGALTGSAINGALGAYQSYQNNNGNTWSTPSANITPDYTGSGFDVGKFSPPPVAQPTAWH